MRAVCGRFVDGLWTVCGRIAVGRLRAFAGVLQAFCGRFAGERLAVLQAFCRRFASGLRASGCRFRGWRFSGWRFSGWRSAVGGLRAVGLRLAVCVWRFAGGLRLAV